jgi:uncharacterized protein YbaP (TraB family)
MILKKNLQVTIFILFCYSSFSQSKYPSILWEIQKKGSSKTSYLFGTYHTSSKGVFKLADSIFYAIKNVDMVGTEINSTTWQTEDDKYDKMKNSYQIFNSSVSDASINQGSFRKTNTIAKLPVFISFQPYSINYFLYRNNKGNEDFEEEAYLDRFIASTGYKFGKKIVGVESYMKSMISSIEAYKESELEEKKSNKKMPDGLSRNLINDMIFNGYKNNNLDIMDSLDKYNYESEAYYKKFIIDRNYDQADSIDYYIKKGNSIFAAVGSAHLPGDDGVIEILRKKGYTLRPVKLNGHDKNQIEAIKNIIAPFTMQKQTIDNYYTCWAPGELFNSFSNPLLKINSYVDMANGGYYLLSRAYNNTFYFGLKDTNVLNAVDSLLYENVKGDIISKKKITYQGYPALDVLSMVKNKDYERYRFIITPYEILKLKVGGKNKYVQTASVDSFFNFFKIDYNNKWHSWSCEYTDKVVTKYRYTQYSADKKTTNGVLKMVLIEDDLKPNITYLKLAAESFTSSFALDKSENLKLDFNSFNDSTIYNYKLESGGSILVKYQIKQPFLYIYYSSTTTGDKPSTGWMNKFTDIKEDLPFNYQYTDSLKAISLKLPYSLDFNSKWKSATEMKTEKPDLDKKLNRDDALDYNPKNVYASDRDSYIFQNPSDLNVVWGVTCNIDSNFYYSNAKLFWSNFIPTPESIVIRKNRNSFSASNYRDKYSSKRSYQLVLEKTNFATNLSFDTANIASQKIQFVIADSNSNKAVYNTYILSNNKVYGFKCIVDYPSLQLPTFYVNLLQNFKPFNNAKAFNIYQPRLDKIVKNYLNVDDKIKSDIAEDLNFYHFSVADLTAATKALQDLVEKNASNNILRKKIVEAICEMDNKKEHWVVVSDWLKNIYENKDELLTIRFLALEYILDQSSLSDLKWVINNVQNNLDFKNSTTRKSLINYFTNLSQKTEAKEEIKLSSFGSPNSGDFFQDALKLYDSGFYNKKQMLFAFNEIQKNTADAKISLALKAEAEQFKYTENEKKKVSSNSSYDNNFSYFTDMFDMFYSALNNDPFFETNFKKIVTSGTQKDKINLLEALVKQKKIPTEWCSQLLQSLVADKNNYLEIYRIYSNNDKVKELPQEFINRIEIAKSYIRGNNYYNQPDTIYHYNTIISPYSTTDSVYFFMYRNKNEKNEEIAYTILPNSLSLFNTEDEIDHHLTNEQLEKLEPFVVLAKKMLRKNYINKLYGNGRNRTFYLRDKDEKSLDIDE